jgi:thioredoxin reductase (NADPH)
VTKQNNAYDVLIAGQGAAAFSAALYAARYQMNSIVVGETFGGETATGGSIENYPGYLEIDGFDLMMKFREQIDKYDVPVIDGKVVSLARSGHCFDATTSEGAHYTASTVILAVGRERRKLGLEHEEEWTGKGVSFCSTCDAPLHKGNVVAVVGGGSAAVEGAILLSKYARQVYIIYRREGFTRPEPVSVRLLENAANVEPILSTRVVELRGNGGLSSIVVAREQDGPSELTVDGLFIEIGADPRIELANQLGLKLNEKNEVKVDKAMKTNVHGVFAAGDLTDASGDLKQTVTAASQGAVAATSAYADMAEHPNAYQLHAKDFKLLERGKVGSATPS